MKKNVICDIDGVILHNNDLIPGADRFVHRLLEQGSKLLFLTNYPAQTQKDLQNRFRSAGIEVPEESFYTPPPWAPPIFSSARMARRPM